MARPAIMHKSQNVPPLLIMPGCFGKKNTNKNSYFLFSINIHKDHVLKFSYLQPKYPGSEAIMWRVSCVTLLLVDIQEFW